VGATIISNSGLPNEQCDPGSYISYNNATNVQGPVRSGSFASLSTTRAASGAGYYGVMDLSGNLWEFLVTVGNSTGRNFQAASHGDGVLDANGDANQPTWPTYTGVGTGGRGGSWFNPQNYMRLSDRQSGAFSGGGGRSSFYGIRGARTAVP
jgi:formylglycine-generating enzyme required for sulfatase activity